MKKIYKSFLPLLLFTFLLCTVGTVKAAGPYEVTVVNSDGTESRLNTYNDYESAKKAMLNHNSDASHVAVIKENGEIISAKYGMLRFHYDSGNPFGENPNNEHRIFATANASNAYTTVHAAYGHDAAFIDFDPNAGANGRAKLKISGFTGWANRGYYDVIPLSKLYGEESWVASANSTWFQELSGNQIKQLSSSSITIRKGPGTNYEAVGYSVKGNTYTYTDKKYNQSYTWYRIGTYPIKTYYRISNGELLHYFSMANTQGVSNLGKAPNFLKEGGIYYSFDGNYFYESLIPMLEDYRVGNYNYDHSLNSKDPYYPYYLYLSNHSRTSYTANDFNQIVINRGFNSSNSKMYGEGANFILSQERHGVNALLTFSAAINESATGSSTIAMKKNNLFGHNAYGSNPFESATTYNTVADGIMAHARMTGGGFNNPSDYRYYGGHYGNLQSGMNVKYATDPYWGEKMATNAYNADKGFGLQEWQGSTIGIKIWDGLAPIKKSPDNNSATIYNLKNNSTTVGNMAVIVTDKVYSNGVYWYKIYSDASLDDWQNIINNGTYNFDKSYGYVEEKYLYVTNQQATIIASDRTIQKGENIDLMRGVLANDPENGNITSSIKVSGEVYINIPGEYRITYTAMDRQQLSVSKTVTITVEGTSIPVITAEDQTVTQYTTFDPKKGLNAKDSIDGDITSKVVITNPVDISKVGDYTVTYKVTNSTGKTTTKTVTIHVIANEKPVITATDKTISLGKAFDPLDGVSATDKEDGKITNIEVTENTVDVGKVGTYKVTYKVKDAAGQITTKTITVTVKEKVLEEKAGDFYLEYLKVVGSKLQIKGYNTIRGIDNTKDKKITYTLVLRNQASNKEYTQELTRLLDESQMTIPIYSEDGKNYKYAWFKSDIDTSKIPEGDYTAYVKAETEDCYSLSVVQNILLNEQEVQYDTAANHVTIINDYISEEIPVTFIVRKEAIGSKKTKAEDNQYSLYNTLAFTAAKQLHINAAAYSVGLDLRASTSVTRKVIFENISTFKKYSYNVGTMRTGPYDIMLINADAFGKKKELAWFDKTIDISNFEKGDYAIYISNVSNTSDYGELSELLFRDLSAVKTTIDGKTYSFTINDNLRNRIELHVK